MRVSVDLGPEVCDIENLPRGDSRILTCEIETNNTPYDLTGKTAHAAAFETDAPDAPVLATFACDTGTPTAGIIEVTFLVGTDHPTTSTWRLWLESPQFTLVRGGLRVEGPG